MTLFRTCLHSLWFIWLTYLSVSCSAQEKQEENAHTKKTYTNLLVHESSPYLLQHAHNPVNWHPWGEVALEKAKKENKLLLISVGYAACHWCHVMEHESFSDTTVARLMNQHFVSVKVDREERPDIDQVYMSACQLMNRGSCGWPLNVIALPDGRPVFGGTYYPKKQWMNILKELHTLYTKDPGKFTGYAEQLTQGIRNLDVIPVTTEKPAYTEGHLAEIFDNWVGKIDFQKGGRLGHPKFPMPVQYEYLLYYYVLSQNAKALEAVNVTLENMAAGGIYDHLGGGFARYSTDSNWKVPHFEKMLYDNGQLVSLYAHAYQLTKNKVFKEVVYQTLDFVEREMQSPEKGFYSSYDADSEGEEGKFYVWKKSEIDQILGKEAALFNEVYQVTATGNWEHKNNIIYREVDISEKAKKHGISEEALKERLKKSAKKLFEVRAGRIKPRLDDKILTSWNALMAKGYIDAYQVFGEEKFLKQAKANLGFIFQKMTDGDRLYRNFKGGKASINGFLDDYALTIQALIALYQVTFEEAWLYKAKKLTEYTLTHFPDKTSGMFFYTSDTDPALITRKIDLDDNVIPSSNSVMARNLYVLGKYFYKEKYLHTAEKMLHKVQKSVTQNGPYYSNWAILMAGFVQPPYEVAIMGKGFEAKRREFSQTFLPQVLWMGGTKEGKLPLLENKLQPRKTMIYVCKDRVCKLPVEDTQKALEQVRQR